MRVRETQPNKISRKEMVTAKKRKEKKKKEAFNRWKVQNNGRELA